MRVLQLVTARQFRGAEIFASILSEELVKLGEEVCFCGIYAPPATPLHPKVTNVMDLGLQTSSTLSIILKLRKLIKSYGPDVIQCNGSDTLKFAVSACLITRGKTPPIIYRNISLISRWIDTPLKRVVYRFLFTKVSTVISVSEATKADFATVTGMAFRQIIAIKRAIAIPEDPDKEKARAEFAAAYWIPKNSTILINVGSLNEEKNHLGLLRIFSKIRKSLPDAKLFVVGDGPLAESLKQYAIDLQVERSVFFVGLTTEPERFYIASDLLLLPSHVEGISGAVLEASSYKVPSVAYNVGGLGEAIQHGVSGSLIPYGKEAEFAAEVVRLIRDPELRSSMGSRAFEYVKSDHNKEQVAEKFRAIYRSLARVSFKRILNLVSQPQLRGAEMFAHDLRNQFIDQGLSSINVYIYKAARKSNFPIEQGDIEMHCNATHFSEKLIGFNPSILISLSSIVREFNPDIIQLHGDRTNKYGAMLRLFRRTDAKLVARIIGDPAVWIKSFVVKRFYAVMFRAVDGIVVVSEQSAGSFRKLFTFDRPFTIIYNGVDFSKYDKAKTRLSSGSLPVKSRKTLLFAGTLDPVKRCDRFLEIVKLVNSRIPCNAFIAGDGPQRQYLEDLSFQLQISDIVTFCGYQSDMSDLYSKADVLVLTSDSEGIPAVILEAAYFAVPSVCSDVGGIHECVHHNETGILVKHDDIEAYATALTALLSDSPRSRRMGEAALNLVRSTFDIKVIGDHYRDFYKTL